MDLEAIKSEKATQGLEDYLPEFVQDRVSELDQLRDACEEKNFELIRSTAHKWKGYAIPYGFNYLDQLARKLEASASASKLDECEELLNELSEYLKVKQELILAR